jgi:mRNA interferase MazF
MAQLVTRVDDDLAAAVDELVAAGVVESRSEAVRVALWRLVDQHRRDEVGARIVEGYRRRPQGDAEIGWADASTVGMDDRRRALVTIAPSQGEIWWAEAEDKRRPVLVVIRTEAVPVLTWILVAPVTRTVRRIPTEIAVGPDHGPHEECAASFDNLQPIRKELSHGSARRPRPGGEARDLPSATGADGLLTPGGPSASGVTRLGRRARRAGRPGAWGPPCGRRPR